MEVLEHVPDPEAVLGRDGAGRVALAARERAARAALARRSTWRAAPTCASSATRPGHLNHWSKRSFARLLGRYGEIVELRSPFPWTMALGAACPSGREPPGRRRDEGADRAACPTAAARRCCRRWSASRGC